MEGNDADGLDMLRQEGVYIENDCVVRHERNEFEAGGAVVTPEQIIAYLGRDGRLQDWHGRQLGTYRVYRQLADTLLH